MTAINIIADKKNCPISNTCLHVWPLTDSSDTRIKPVPRKYTFMEDVKVLTLLKPVLWNVETFICKTIRCKCRKIL